MLDNLPHSRVKIKDALTNLQEYLKLSKKDRSFRVGTLLRNYKTETDGSRQTFIYNFSGVKICKGFFCYIHAITKRAIDRLQKCIKENNNFSYKLGGNHKLDADVYENLHKYLKRKLESWTLPNPSGLGPECYLPTNFNWKTVYTEFCDDYKNSFSVDFTPLSWRNKLKK